MSFYKSLYLSALIVVFSNTLIFAEETSETTNIKPVSSATLPSAPAPEVSVVQSALKRAEALIAKEQLTEAKQELEGLLSQELTKKERNEVQTQLEDVNIKLLFSPIPTPDSTIYVVKSGDALSKIAKKNNTNVELIKKSNRLSKDIIYPGMKLKIPKNIFSIEIDLSQNKLALLSGEELVKMYPVATGKKGHETPKGVFTITTKLENPVWYKTGAVVPPDSPANILGTRWMGFSLKSYGIHGTTLPETVGTHASDGCIRMYNKDVEELYTIVPLNTKVTIAD